MCICLSYFLMLSFITSGMDSYNVLWLWTHRMSSGIESYNIRMCLVYARSSTSYSMYTFMSRWLPKTLCHNVCGISSEPVTAVAVYSQHSVPALIWHLLWTFLLIWQRTQRSNIHWTSGMCCETFMLELYWLQRVPWLCNVIVRDFFHGMKSTPYETTRMSWSLPTVQCKKSRIWRNS